MSETNVVLAGAYYKAISEKNIENVSQYLHPDVQFLAPLAEMKGKDAVLEGVKNFMFFIKSIKIRTKSGSGNHVMLAYDVDCPVPIGVCRTASLLTFKSGLIINIELFYDAKPFGK